MTERHLGDGAIRRSSLYGSSTENTYAGALSFMRRNYTRVLDGVDVVVSGIPLDLATTFRPGARFGPAAVRAASVQLAELNPYPWGFNPFDDLAVTDYGDCWFDAHNPCAHHPALGRPHAHVRRRSFHHVSAFDCARGEVRQAALADPLRCPLRHLGRR